MSFSLAFPVRLLAVALVSATVLANPMRDDNDQVRKELDAAYAKRDNAFKDKDATAIKSMETPDYIQKSKDGTVADRPILDPQVDRLLAMLKEIKVLFTTIDKVTEGKAPDEFMVDATSKGDFTFKLEDGSIHEEVASAKVRDTWVHTKDGWRIKYHQELETATLLDGKPIP